MATEWRIRDGTFEVLFAGEWTNALTRWSFDHKDGQELNAGLRAAVAKAQIDANDCCRSEHQSAAQAEADREHLAVIKDGMRDELFNPQHIHGSFVHYMCKRSFERAFRQADSCNRRHFTELMAFRIFEMGAYDLPKEEADAAPVSG